MNKQEAIEKLKEVSWECEDNSLVIDFDYAQKIINQIDEPQKIAVPQMIFDVIESFDEDIYHLHEHMSIQPFEVKDWVTHNEREFYEAWLAYPNIALEEIDE